MAIKKMGTKIWILIIVLILSLLAIFVSSNPLSITFLEKGALITSVDQDSDSFEQGLRKGQIIKSIDGVPIESVEDFSNAMEKFPFEEETKTIIKTKKAEIVLFIKESPKITVSEIPKTNIKTGLDLSGGARALIKAEGKELSQSEVSDLVEITSNRFDVYGISDVDIRSVSDLSGEHFMSVEIAGATPEDLEDLISQQGKFEAKIGNETVFRGGDKDIASVCRNDAQCAGITNCNSNPDGTNYCTFRFTVYLSENAAKKHAEVTSELSVNESNPEYLSKKIDLYLDDQKVDSLLIGKDLKGRETTQIQISGSGQGKTEEDAYNTAQEEMKNLQTVLITGSLPYKLEIVKLDTISPILGKDFINAILITVLIALIAVAIVIFVRYKKLKSAIALLGITISEVIIVLGIASVIKWNLDLPSIAGILATIGTGIDDLIILLDESLQKISLSLKQKLKRAFAIIMGAYFTTLVSLLPLMWAGAGLLKGFAITTIIGISVGVFITRPAFGELIRRFEK